MDAHRTDPLRNVSAFATHTFDVRAAGGGGGGGHGGRGDAMLASAEPCVLQFRVLPSTGSGGHKFKLRSATITPSRS